jgi:hypothetical protein
MATGFKKKVAISDDMLSFDFTEVFWGTFSKVMQIFEKLD